MTSMYKNLQDKLAVNGEDTAKWTAASKDYFQAFIGTDQILKHFSDQITIVLHGSTTWNIDDAHSDLDYWLALDEQEHEKLRTITEQSFIPVVIDGKQGHLNPLRLSQLEKCFDNRIDMALINEISASIVIADKKNIFQDYQELSHQPLSEPVKYAFFFNNYVAMRASHRSCDNPMERGDEFAALYSVMQTLKHALQAAFVLDNSTYPYEKWLYAHANFSETPKSLLESVDSIISEIKRDPAALYGSAKENKVNRTLHDVRDKLVEKSKRAGIDELWLEKWWRYIDRSREIISEVRWCDK